ncbi:mediator complex, subunit Med21 [Dipodascopsis tothii]|uniref:mediator complex, subunit Med21 n=1 Tax=Dipodascopsis tothii TaxID=44089 RepID=UPI0034CE739D
MVKSRQIDLLISSLPGIGVSEADQLDRMRALEQQLVAADGECRTWIARRDELLDKCDRVILELSRRKTEIESS